jgi:hypothetical protein
VAGVLVALWGMLPPFSGPPLAVARRVEIADHVVPGLVVLAFSCAALVASRAGASPTWLLIAGLVVTLAGVWMTATHVPLVMQARGGDAPWGATIYHTAPSVAVLALGSLWSVAYWKDLE